MITVIAASHGPMASAMLESAAMVYGKMAHLRAVTLRGDTGIDGFKREFAQTLEAASAGADGVLVLCDMQSGTPWNVACQYAFSAEIVPPVAVIGGMSFPMLLQTDDIVHFVDVHAAARHLIDLTLPTLVLATPGVATQSDDF